MAASDYVRGEMDIEDQKNTWAGFMTASLWGGLITTLVLAYATLTIALGMNWMVALVLCAGAAIVGGMAMGMGGAWIATVVGLAALAVLIQAIIGAVSLLF